jgi:hypothetical protein
MSVFLLPRVRERRGLLRGTYSKPLVSRHGFADASSLPPFV